MNCERISVENCERISMTRKDRWRSGFHPELTTGSPQGSRARVMIRDPNDSPRTSRWRDTLPGRGMRETVEALVRASEGRTYIPELQQQQIPPHTSWSCRCNTLPLPTPRGSPRYSMKGELPDVEGRLTGSGQLAIGIDGWVNEVTSDMQIEDIRNIIKREIKTLKNNRQYPGLYKKTG